MSPERLAERHPTLYHLADERNWPSIRRHGLLSTTALLERLGLPTEQRAAVDARHRPAAVRFDGAALGPDVVEAVVRDQHPLDPAALARCLTADTTPEEFYRLLNGRVYLWPTRDRLERMLKYYDARPQRVMEFDTAALLARHAGRVELSHINSGFATAFYKPAARGRGTFVPLALFPEKKSYAVAEVTVPAALPDALELVRAMTVVQRGQPDRPG